MNAFGLRRQVQQSAQRRRRFRNGAVCSIGQTRSVVTTRSKAVSRSACHRSPKWPRAFWTAPAERQGRRRFRNGAARWIGQTRSVVITRSKAVSRCACHRSPKWLRTSSSSLCHSVTEFGFSSPAFAQTLRRGKRRLLQSVGFTISRDRYGLRFSVLLKLDLAAYVVAFDVFVDTARRSVAEARLCGVTRGLRQV